MSNTLAGIRIADGRLVNTQMRASASVGQALSGEGGTGAVEAVTEAALEAVDAAQAALDEQVVAALRVEAVKRVSADCDAAIATATQAGDTALVAALQARKAIL